MEEITLKDIEKIIYIIRGQKVMLDSDLAELYGVETKNLNKAVSRNIERFPEDFRFRLNEDELTNLRFQIGTSSLSHGGRRYTPYVFTEHGIAMLSSVLRSERAVKVHLSIIRTFIKLRKIVKSDEDLAERFEKFEEGTNQIFKVVFERLDNLEAEAPALPTKRKKIGLNSK